MKIHRLYYNLAKKTADLSLQFLSFFIADYLSKLKIDIAGPFFSFEYKEILTAVILVLTWLMLAGSLGLYDEFRTRDFKNEISLTLRCVLWQVVLLALTLFMLKDIKISRYFMAAFYAMFVPLVMIEKTAIRLILNWLRKIGRNLRFILIVGVNDLSLKFYKKIGQSPYWGYKIVGFLDDCLKPELGNLYLGRTDQLESVLDEKHIDEVIIVLPNSAEEQIMSLIVRCDKHTIRAKIIPDIFRLTSPKFSLIVLGDFPIISVRDISLDEFPKRALKRIFDVAISLLSFILVFSWLWPMIVLAIKISSPGPVLFKQERWGKDNKKFRCYKFRSMIKESRDVDDNGLYVQAKRNDSRVTKIGRFLRKTGMDELPQFINVLKGDMSIVGPRPHPTPLNTESKDSVKQYMLRHLIKPGITGFAQINGHRGETAGNDLMQKRVEDDLFYINNWTFRLDTKIIFKTIARMMVGDKQAF